MTKIKVKDQSLIYRIGRAIDGNLFHAVGFCLLMTLIGMVGLPTLWAALAAISMLTVRQGLPFSIVPAGFMVTVILIISHFTILSIFPVLVTLLAAEMYRQKYSIVLIFECFTLAAMAAVVVIHIVYPDIASWWLSYYEPIQKMMLADKAADQAVIKQWFTETTKMATGLAGLSLIYKAMISLVLGLLWSDKLSQKRKTIKELLEVRISLVLLIIAAFGLLAWVVRFKWMVDILPVIIGAIALYGILVLSCIAWYLFARSTWVYIVLITTFFLLLFPAVKFGLILLAVTDYFADWRSIFKSVTTAKSD